MQRYRRYRVELGSLSTNSIHRRHPWVVAWWSAAFPGNGYLMLGMYAKGFTLILWELFINYNAKINIAMMYSFTGRFELAKSVLDIRWMLLYIAVYLYGIWDSYRIAVDFNKLSVLIEREDAPIRPFKLTMFGINFLDKRTPYLALLWSLLTPGLGHLYVRLIPTGFFLLSCWIGTAYFSHLFEAVHHTIMGSFSEAASVLDPEWFLFMPSLYGFALYDSYVISVESNKLFGVEQAQFFRRRYQSAHFAMPYFSKKRL
ncbi:hypothetical protein DLM86_24820 [Paenibacillus flagellatus]|uniref:Uncharacterized protein n=2 Tax=Paenibacillus flagellatus TaxID=2211139 RepID=A0A2V5JXS2_9BACL|nr:hypothetical protein DLM86_24820 [Paenibacillus flagellatus]